MLARVLRPASAARVRLLSSLSSSEETMQEDVVGGEAEPVVPDIIERPSDKSQRQERVESALRSCIAVALHEVQRADKCADALARSFAVTEVDCSRDLRVATVFLRPLAGITRQEEPFYKRRAEALKGFLRARVAERIHLKFVPKLILRMDVQSLKARRLDDIFEKIRSERVRANGPESKT
jgi:ribosome-binding factor A